MVAELTPNYDERTSLVSYRFLFGWIGGGTITLLAGAALDLIAFPRPDPGAPPPVIAPEQATALGWIVGPGLLGLWVCTLFFLSRYRLTRAEHTRVLAELERRVQAVG
jgi:Na+/melibiose symporter-like transporter